MNRLSGENHYGWKGDLAREKTKRERAQKLFALGFCEKCGTKAVDRHHIDGDTGNNVRKNILLLCRRCHMIEDGRLNKFLECQARISRPKEAKACRICARERKPIRHGRCSACSEYYRRNKVERINEDGQANERLRKQRADDLPKGVVFVERKLQKPYSSRAYRNGKTHYLGYFKTAAEASKAREEFLCSAMRIKT